MTTIINTPPNNGGSDSGSTFGIIIIIIILLVGGFLIYRYGWHRAAPATNINVTLPATTGAQN